MPRRFTIAATARSKCCPIRSSTPADTADRNVILYGNADTNSAWAVLLTDCPVEVKRGAIRVGDRTETGDDLAVLMVRPRPDSDTALVGVVGGTGPAGMRLTNRLRWFVSGITYPDLMILGPKVLTEGTSDIRAWGLFRPRLENARTPKSPGAPTPAVGQALPDARDLERVLSLTPTHLSACATGCETLPTDATTTNSVRIPNHSIYFPLQRRD